MPIAIIASASRRHDPSGRCVGASADGRVYNFNMAENAADDWSPADNPYAIAVSEGQWWLSMARLSAARLGDPNDPRAMPMCSQQVDARVLVIALAQLLNAERLEQTALKELGMPSAVRDALSQARAAYLAALPGIREVRNGLTHFENWARGEGLGPQARLVESGQERRLVARNHWGFAYDPRTRTLRFGSHEIDVDGAVASAGALHRAIYLAAIAVDERSHTPRADEPEDHQ